MRHYIAFQTRTWFAIHLLLGFALVSSGLLASGCATSANHVKASSEFGIKAEAVPEGIQLTLSNIPPDTVQLWIWITYADVDYESSYDVIASYASINDASITIGGPFSNQLDKVKQTGKVVFPVAEAGRKYYITVNAYNKQAHESILADGYLHPHSVDTVLTANDGTYFNRNDVKLNLNNSNSAITLSSEPVFSSALSFDKTRYYYGVTISVDEINGSLGIGTQHVPQGLSSDGLSWTFEPEMTDNIRKSDWLESGVDYSAYATAYAVIVYDDIVWSVEIAKTKGFTYSL